MKRLITTHHTHTGLLIKVNQYLEEGDWMKQGGPFVHGSRFCQTLVRRPSPVPVISPIR
jgi:hypothetical protein